MENVEGSSINPVWVILLIEVFSSFIDGSYSISFTSDRTPLSLIHQQCFDAQASALEIILNFGLNDGGGGIIVLE